MAAPSKLLAEWFWTDRWMGSSGFLLPMLARGVYREMLTQAWRRGAKLPNDFQAIQRAIGATPAEWSEAWPIVSHFWRIDAANNLVNDTQIEIYKEAQAAVERSHDRAVKAAQARHKQSTSTPQAQLEQCPPSPSPSPSLISDTVSISDSEKKLKSVSNGNGHGDGRSKRPIYQSDRFVIFEWQLDNLSMMLGPHTDSFDLHAFFDTLSKQSRDSGLVIPANTKNGQFWDWMQAQVRVEAERRGLQFAEAPFESKLTKQLRQATAESLERHHGPRPRRLSSNV